MATSKSSYPSSILLVAGFLLGLLAAPFLGSNPGGYYYSSISTIEDLNTTSENNQFHDLKTSLSFLTSWRKQGNLIRGSANDLIVNEYDLFLTSNDDEDETNRNQLETDGDGEEEDEDEYSGVMEYEYRIYDEKHGRQLKKEKKKKKKKKKKVKKNITPSPTMSLPSDSPSTIPSEPPSVNPTISPSTSPSNGPTSSPSVGPTIAPSHDLSSLPTTITTKPTTSPTSFLTTSPSMNSAKPRDMIAPLLKLYSLTCTDLIDYCDATIAPSVSRPNEEMPSDTPNTDLQTASPSAPSTSPADNVSLMPHDSSHTGTPPKFPSPPPIAPTDSTIPPSCVELKPDYIESKYSGSPNTNVPLPVGAVEIVSATGDTVQFQITQLWVENDFHETSNGAELVAIHYHNGIGTTECAILYEMPYMESTTKTAYCYCGYTDMSVYVYLDELDEEYDECDACKRPNEDDSLQVVAYYFELPCDSSCDDSNKSSEDDSGVNDGDSPPTTSPTMPATGTPSSKLTPTPTGEPSTNPSKSPMPSSCTVQLEADYLSSKGADIQLPHDAVEIISATGDAVEFKVTQLWTEDAVVQLIAIQYNAGVGSLACDTVTDLEYTSSTSRTALCYCGYTDVQVYVYLGELDETFDSCNACTTPLDEDDPIVVYSFELPCDSPCISGPEDYGSPYGNEPIPRDLPNAEPTMSPMPSSCSHTLEADLINMSGAEVPLPLDAVGIVSATGNTVSFSVTQLWSEDDQVELIAIQYHNGAGTLECDAKYNMEYASSTTQTAYCYCGFTDVSIYVYLEELEDTLDSCDACMPLYENEDDASLVVYSFELPCDTPCATSLDDNVDSQSSIPDDAPSATPSPAPSLCIEQLEVDLLRTVPPTTPLPTNAISILEADGEIILFSVSQFWKGGEENDDGGSDENSGVLPLLAVHYHNEIGSTDCSLNRDMGYGVEYSQQYRAHCYCGYTDVSIYVHLEDGEIDPGDACNSPNVEDVDGILAYYFEIPCVDPCAADHDSNQSSSDLESPSPSPLTF